MDARASWSGLSRCEYLRRRLDHDAVTAEPVTATDLAVLAEAFVDLGDPTVVKGARERPTGSWTRRRWSGWVEDRAVDVATADLADLVVLHVDMDVELIAEITGQPTERLVTS